MNGLVKSKEVCPVCKGSIYYETLTHFDGQSTYHLDCYDKLLEEVRMVDEAQNSCQSGASKVSAIEKILDYQSDMNKKEYLGSSRTFCVNSLQQDAQYTQFKKDVEQARVQLFYWQRARGDATNFAALLFDLICKADLFNYAKIKEGFPEYIYVYEQWKNCPSPRLYFEKYGLMENR